MIKKTLLAFWVIGVLSLLSPGETFWYFENKFLCTIQETSITVSLHEWEKPCFDYISKIAVKINTLEEDISIAQQYIDTNRDIEYWTTIADTLSITKNDFEFSRNQIVTSMSDYENELFLRIKVLVYFYLKPERVETEAKIKQADTLLLRMKLSWNWVQYDTVLNKRDDLHREWMLLDAIKRASSFETLVFPLKTYLDWQEATLQQNQL